MRERSIKIPSVADLRRQVPAGAGIFIMVAASLLIWCLIVLVARML